MNKYNLDIGTDKKQWLEFFGNKPFSHRPVDMVERAEGMLEMTHWTKEERAMLDEKRRIREIRIAEEEYFWHKGLEEGMEKGIEGRTVEIATKMLNEGLSFDMISKLTGLSQSQLQQLKTGHLS